MNTWKHKLAAVLFSLTLCAVVLLIGEICCRLFTDVNLRRTSRDFVVTDANGIVFANAKNARGVSFGQEVFSDENGFRINPRHEEQPHDKAVLLLGDSVTFGVGVPEEKTFAGQFREKLNDTTVYNSGVVGLSIYDYRRIVGDFVPNHKEVKTVYLFYCLNDFHEPSEVNARYENQTLWRKIKLQIADWISDFNEFFGARSKLYVYLTGKFIDPADKYFQSDFSSYQVDDEKFNRIMKPLSEISEELKSRHIKFVIFINPYEKQLRSGAENDLMPQKKIESYFDAHQISYVDTLTNFKDTDPEQNFLFADPMHLSEKGHKIVFDRLWQNWTALQQ